MPNLILRIADDHDLDLLSKLNKQLIIDEQHNNPMNEAQLKDRMADFIHTDCTAYLFIVDHQTVGYALVNHKKQPLYLRHFFICREFRRLGYGTAAFQKLLELLHTNCLDLEVLTWNESGRKFWQALGFKEKSVYMRYEI